MDHAGGGVGHGWPRFLLAALQRNLPGAPWIAGACGVQSLLLAAAALLPLRRSNPAPRLAATALLAAALCYPLLAPLTGHPWTEAEVFAFMPEPTALATLGVAAWTAAGSDCRSAGPGRPAAAVPDAGRGHAVADRLIALRK
jgi:hypothetical protein